MTVAIITTERLMLRSVNEKDFEPLYALVFGVPEVMANAFEGKTFTKERAWTFFTDQFDGDGNGLQLGALVLKDSDTIIGFAGLLSTSVLGCNDYEFGFVLGLEYWGRGYATEIGRAQIEYGFNTKKYNRLLALVADNNRASKTVLEKLGMTFHSSIVTQPRGKRDIYVVQVQSEPIAIN
ncbi:MAG: GNAT family N-acetyltransferase [Oceanospirillaceae bacterium]|nr:GNAT family N-acetyltransferase [Oceanospirillaceae bacterium]